MVTFALHLFLALINVFGAAQSFLLWKYNPEQKKTMELLFLFYSFFFCYHFALSLPFWIFGGNLEAMAWGYIIAIGFIYLVTAPMYKLMVFQILGVSELKSNKWIYFLVFLGIFVVSVLISNFSLPEITASGFVIWHSNIVAGMITFIACASITIAWAFIYLRNKPSGLTFSEKIKAFNLTVGGLMYSLSSVYFIAGNETTVILSFVFIFLGTIIFSIPVFLPNKETTQNL